MKKNRKLIIGIIVTSLIVILAIAWLMARNNTDTSSQNDTTVRYAAPLTIAAAPAYIADAKGFWKEEGINVEMTYFDSGRKALDALLSNNAELMSVSETPPLRAYLGGSKINIITTVTEHKEAKLTVRTDKITTAEDFKGKKIGTVAGTNSDYYMYRWLESNNIDKNDVDIVQLDASALAQAFVQGNVDAMFAWEPHNYNAYSKITDQAKSWPTEADIYSGRHTVVMNSAYLQDNEDKAERIIKGFIKAEDYIKSNPEDAKKIVRDKTGMTEEALNELWAEYTYKVELDDGLLNIIKNEADWITSSEANKSNVDVSQLINASALLKVDPSRVGEAFEN